LAEADWVRGGLTNRLQVKMLSGKQKTNLNSKEIFFGIGYSVILSPSQMANQLKSVAHRGKKIMAGAFHNQCFQPHDCRSPAAWKHAPCQDFFFDLPRGLVV
jgi:hypothetical protein